MDEALRPADAGEVAAAVADAAAARRPLEVRARGTKRGWGRAVNAGAVLDVSGLAGIVDHEPAELLLTARPATPLAEIEAALAARRQMLAFEPPELGPLWGEGGGTLGGAIACNLSGPRRVKAGAARDHFLAFQAVGGRGEIFKGGGKVVKNVTGYDLPKLLAGSFGTLAVLTEVTVKVLPAPDRTRTVLVAGLDAATACAALADALNSPYEVSGAAFLPEAVARRSAVAHVSGAGASVAAIRVEGTASSVAARCAALRTLLAARGDIEELHSANSVTLWREIGAVALLPDPARALWRVSVPPTSGAALLAGHDGYLDWGGGLAWIAADPEGDGGAASLRAAVAAAGGHATLMRGPAALRARVPVFEPLDGALAALTRRVKAAHDPSGILNPGRMHAGL